MKNSILTAAAAVLFAGGAMASTVNFENEALGPNDVTNATNGGTYVNGGITFTSLDGNDLFLVGTGGGADGFVPSDNVTPAGEFGTTFLTGDFDNNSSMSLKFGLANSIMFDIADIDGGTGNQQEIFTFKFLLGGSFVDEIMRKDGDPEVAGPDGGITKISFSGLFDEVQIFNRTKASETGSNRDIGWGIDNIHVSEVPLPAGMVLTLTALGGLGALRARRRKS